MLPVGFSINLWLRMENIGVLKRKENDENEKEMKKENQYKLNKAMA